MDAIKAEARAQAGSNGSGSEASRNDSCAPGDAIAELDSTIGLDIGLEAARRTEPARLIVTHRCVRCGEAIHLEAWRMDIWCRPIAPTYVPFPRVLQRDCDCGGHANVHIGLLPFDPRPSDSRPGESLPYQA